MRPQAIGDGPLFEEMAEIAKAAVRVTTDLVSQIAPTNLDIAADLVESLAVLECLAVEATFDRGRVRRKLCDIARSKAARCRSALDIVVAWEILPAATVAAAQVALDQAMTALAPPRRLPLSELLRR